MRNINKIYIFVGLIILASVIFCFFRNFINLTFLQQQQQFISAFIANQFWLASMLFLLLYVVVCACALPFGGILTFSGGYFFGLANTALIVCIGATIGAVIAFLLARYVFQEAIERQYPSQLQWLNKELDKHGMHYLLFMRLMPFMPYFIINPVAGLTRISLFTFTWTMALGVIPGSFVLAFAGREFAQVNSLAGVFSLNVVGALGLLALFALMPMVIQKLKNGRAAHSVEFDVG